MINRTLCITEYNNRVISWLDVNSRMEQLSVTDSENDIVGNIYIGRVKNIAKNIRAAFIEFSPDTLGFLSFNDLLDDTSLKEGEFVAVQVIKEASKNKDAVLSMHLSITGDYSIVELGKPSVNISRKITGDRRAELRAAVNDYEHSVIVRTNAGLLEDISILTAEIDKLSAMLDTIVEKSKTRNSISLIHEAKREYERFVASMPIDAYDRVLTDIESIYKELSAYKCEFYADSYPLIKLYSLQTKLDELLSRNVWLKSGANIVIDYTEAMTVIDVNSAKNMSKKNQEDNILAVNKEATLEICRQIRLRNISGIIIIDYINMSSADNENELVDYLKKELLKDGVRCDFVDITKLGLVELVRRKIKPPINELLSK